MTKAQALADAAVRLAPALLGVGLFVLVGWIRMILGLLLMLMLFSCRVLRGLEIACRRRLFV